MIRKNILIFVLICFVSLFCVVLSSSCSVYSICPEHSATNPIKKVYLRQQGEDTYSFCVDLEDKSGFSPRIHTLQKGAKIILSFKRSVHTPKNPKIRNHKILNGYFFEKIGDCSMILVVSFNEPVIFLEQYCTDNSIRLKFRIQKRHTVVIDAGHGGKDPGTCCLSGDFEKNVVLVAAIELRNMLVESGRYKVILTRDSDKFLSVSERRKMAENEAEFLISLHTDSNKDENMRGMSVYTLPTLDFVRDKDKACKACVGKLDSNDYYKILAKSRKFANILVGYIPTACKLKSKPSRSGDLKILKVPYPAVLVELGYVSNRVDNELIHSKDFREKINRAILYALDESL